MTSDAFIVKLVEYIRTARRQLCGLFDKPDLTILVRDMGGHKKPAHVSLDNANCRMSQNLTRQSGSCRRTRVSMTVPSMGAHEEMSALLQLVAILRAATLDVLHGLRILNLMLLKPSKLVFL